MKSEKRPSSPGVPPLLAALSESKVYQDYEDAFTRGTGLPLTLHAPAMMSVMRHARRQQNPFCALMATTNQSCAQCYALQQQLENEAQLAPKTLKCFAGLCETAVPVRVGDKLIAFLQTGQVLLHRPSKAEFSKTTRTLLSWGTKVDLKKLEEAYFNTRVIAPEQYEALVRLLTVFAGHLAACANALSLKSEHAEPEAVARARAFIEANAQDDLRLSAVAQMVNMSANYFSEKFHEATGMTFVEFIGRTRVERARNLLQNPRWRISEVAFEVGFQSLSQFNRSFKEYAGQSPSEYRAGISQR